MVEYGWMFGMGREGEMFGWVGEGEGDPGRDVARKREGGERGSYGRRVVLGCKGLWIIGWRGEVSGFVHCRKGNERRRSGRRGERVGRISDVRESFLIG